jgi:hypothetical protein
VEDGGGGGDGGVAFVAQGKGKSPGGGQGGDALDEEINAGNDERHDEARGDASRNARREEPEIAYITCHDRVDSHCRWPGNRGSGVAKLSRKGTLRADGGVGLRWAWS